MIANVPTVAGRSTAAPKRIVARVLVSSVNAASMRAVNYATTLGIDDTRAVNFAFSEQDVRTIRHEWSVQGPRLTLEIDEAPYRDIGGPLLRYLRDLTAEEGTEVLVLMPELDHARLAAPPPQPALAVHQAPAPARAGSHPRQRPVPDAAMKIGGVDVRDVVLRARRRLRRLARRTAAFGFQSIVVPLLGREETQHAVDLACRLAADRRARVVLVAPLVVQPDLPLDAQFVAETAELRAELGDAASIADSYESGRGGIWCVRANGHSD